MTHTYTWTTARGAKIEAIITADHITEETICGVKTSADVWMRSCNSLKVNGKEMPEHTMSDYAGKPVIVINRSRNQMVAIPADIEEVIFGEQKKAEAERAVRRAAADARYEAHTAMMRKAMEE